MTIEYNIRREKADEINDKLQGLSLGVLIVGSVAYNPNAVTPESDLDLVGILDFSTVDFEELYKRLDQKHEPLLVEHASTGRINNVSVVWDTPEYEVGLHLWDKSAFDKVVNLEGYNFIFRRTNFGRNFKSTANVEVLKNLKGEEKEIYKDPKEVDGGHILKFYTFFEDGFDFYPGIQLNNLLLDPIVLSEKENSISQGIEQFKENLRERLTRMYGNISDDINLYNSLSPKLQRKITLDLKQKLENFF